MDYELINLHDYTRTGEGATAVAYTHKSEPRLAKLSRTLHAMKANTSALPPFRETMRNFYRNEPSAPDYLREKVFAFLDAVPDTPTCLPYAAIRIPFMLNMAYRSRFSEGLAKFVISLLPKD